MINDKPKVLFVDDEENIRLTLGMYLDEKGFRVTTAATVPEALKLITQQKFDVLIADLNVGYPGDGFTVVSAMRRTHRGAVTFILTGYPAFDTALQAIRLQVDDYITKPTDTDELVDKIRQRLAEPKPVRYVPTKRLAEIVSENVGPITRHWLEAVRRDPELNAIPMSDSDRKDHVPRFLQVALKSPAATASPTATAPPPRSTGPRAGGRATAFRCCFAKPDCWKRRLRAACRRTCCRCWSAI